MQGTVEETEQVRQQKLKALLMSTPVNDKEDTSKFWHAYLLSVVLCPLGLYYAFKFYYIDEEKHAALVCLIITIVVGVIEIFIFGAIFGSVNLGSIGKLSGVATVTPTL
jgi:hypothetical protein